MKNFVTSQTQVLIRKNHSMMKTGLHTGGFSLLEVLISIVILSFGLLGMVGLQAAALQANREARTQSTATSLARELAELMRGNEDVALSAVNPYLVNLIAPLTLTTASYCLNVANTTACTPIQIANAQMTEWLARVNSGLPGARVLVCLDSAPFDSNGVPRWNCTTTGTDPTTVIKMGWTRGVTDRSATGNNALDLANAATSVPALIFPITAGNPV